MKIFSVISILAVCVIAQAQLTVTVAPPKTKGQKAVVELTIKNELTNEVKSARAICILVDEQGKMVGQSTKWVIGQNKTHLEPKGESKFDFVITTPQPLISSNLTAKVMFSRVILDGGKMADVRQDVEVMPADANDKSKSQ
ncbi:MAG TPA: hypothetical protein VGY56_00325 [Verrucomicrobiae bacterium]|nr:hypothetical protein [Verrucomicrobiae bacterium]